MSFYDVHGHYNVNYFLYAYGLAVKTEYRGRGIASELLKARSLLMRAYDISVTTSIFTTHAGQKAAAKTGFSENFAISYETLQDKFKDLDFSGVDTPICKVLSLQI